MTVSDITADDDPFYLPDDVDLRGFSGFMLNIDRLLASELVALGTPEECWAALMLWCRAWKQTPPGSLPNDDRALRAFSGAGSRWKKVKEVALHGFVLRPDGRLHHPVVIEQVRVAWGKRQKYRNDQDRLRDWREKKRREEHPGNAVETQSETHFNGVSTPVSSGVSERDKKGQGQGQGQGQKSTLPPKPPEATDDPAFAIWWERYPRKEDKGHARTAWTTAMRKTTPEIVIAGLKRYHFQPDPKFHPLPATWLNGERWADQSQLIPDGHIDPQSGRRVTPMSGGF